jgi:glyoxylase-like metal-dependent hydrolase (beta-lactamase superfamily II)
MAVMKDWGQGIVAIDAQMLRPTMVAIHLIEQDGHAALVDTGTLHSVSHVMDALAERGIAPEAVDWVILTHIHLDHAGGAGRLMQLLPNARLAVHPRGSRHMAQPAKLWQGAVAVYGEEYMRETYGEVLPIAPERITELPDGATIRLGSREFLFMDTPGHARHHVAFVDSRTGHVFAGDTFGLSYRELDGTKGELVFPTSSPVQFDPDEAHASVDKMLAHKPDAVYVTHYSQLRDIPRLAANMHRLIDAHSDIARRHAGAGEQRESRILADLQALLLDECIRTGSRATPELALATMELDLGLNAQGLVVWLDAQAA